MSKERNARKRIYNSCSVQLENAVTRGNSSTSLGKPRDVEQLPSDSTIKDSNIPSLGYLFCPVTEFSGIKEAYEHGHVKDVIETLPSSQMKRTVEYRW